MPDDSKIDVSTPDKPEEWKWPTKFECHGITPEKYKSVLLEQNGVCAICGLPETAKKSNYSDGVRPLSIDHCHGTGVFRGLLCSLCNSGLGMFKDDMDVIASAVSYLKNVDLAE